MTNIWDKSVSEHKRRIEEHIIEVALELISEKGMSEVSMSELAKSAGVSRQTLYNYFSDIGQVIRAWMENEIGREYEELKHGISELEEPIEKLSAYLRISLRSCAEHQHHPGVEAAMGVESEAWDEVWGQYSKTLALLKNILEEGIVKGQFRKDMDLEIYSNLIFHMTSSLHHMMGEKQVNPDEMSDAILDMVLNGIKA